MTSFEYTITDENGLHARLAGLLARKAQSYESSVTLECDGMSKNAAELVPIMSMDIQQGDAVKVLAEGADEEQAAAELKRLFEENM